MKKFYPIAFLLVWSLISISCFEDYDDNPQYSDLEVKDFIWKKLNLVYIYKQEVLDLHDDRFSSNEEYTEYINSYGSPENLFEDLKYLPDGPNAVDRFSRLFADYFELEQLLGGTSLTSGMEFYWDIKPNSSNEVFCTVRLVLENSNASSNGITRGMMFDKVDGVQLYYNSDTDNNFYLFGSSNFSISMATYNTNGTPETSDDSINPTGETINLSRTAYNENPIYDTEIITLDNGEKLGYLMYNGFYSNYNSQLNDVFATFQSNGVQHLALDLRYNGGGSVQTAAYLGSMVTGQFNGQVFSTLQYNENLANNNQEYLFTSSIDGGSGINNLGLDKVYVITTRSTASASEMIINSLKEYISVVQIGTTTTGKSQASRIVYDSPQIFNRNNVNPNHTYAMLPLIAISFNANEMQVPSTGIVPDITNELSENVLNLGVLGNPSEPLLAKVIEVVENSSRVSTNKNETFIEPKELPALLKQTDFIMYE